MKCFLRLAALLRNAIIEADSALEAIRVKSPSALTDLVASQYESWVYPEPIFDLPVWLANNWQWFDPSHSHPIYWPDREYNPFLDILIAGCGTNQAAVFAYNNPGARIVAIDVSEASLDHHRFLQSKYGLKNLELHRLSIEDACQMGLDFDLIVSTGVLHHLADPMVGLDALAGCLRPDGVVAIMLYARYGRIGVEMLQAVFRELGLQQNATSLLMVKEALAALAEDHPLRSYLNLAPDLNFDAGLVDTFLHGRDRSYAVDDCLALVDSSGLIFQDWFLKASYYPVPSSNNEAFLTSVAALPERRQWAVMEQINARNACHFFTACRKERPRESYRIDFSSEQFVDYKPDFRFRCGLDGSQIYGPNWRLQLDAIQFAMVQMIDGQRSIRQIVQAARSSGVLPRHDDQQLERLAAEFFASIWKRDLIAIRLDSLSLSEAKPRSRSTRVGKSASRKAK